MNTAPAASGQTGPRRVLGLLDGVCLIVGIIVGVGIYQVAPDVARGAGGIAVLFGVWIVGGVLSFSGAMCYAELATAYPQPGGDYVYLSRAYGSWAGFLFGWMQLAIVRPGDIAVIAFAFAAYARVLWDPFPGSQQVFAAAAVAALTLVNILGVAPGKWTQNLLTFAKIAGLGGVVAVAFLAGSGDSSAPLEAAGGGRDLPLTLALILVLFTFGGWNEMAYVAGEVVNPARNIRRALVLGTVLVTLLYVIVNAAYLRALGFDGLIRTKSVAADAVAAAFPGTAAALVSALVCVSALGAVSGMILTGARISFALGAGHAAFRWLGSWNPRTGTPVRALALQGAVAVSLVFVFGSFLDTLIYTAAPVYLFYTATSAAVIVLRRREPATPRPYRVLGYPVVPVVFAATCTFLVWSAVAYRPWSAAAALLILLAGGALFAARRPGASGRGR